MSDRITWTNDKRKLSDLIPWPRNPRQVKVEQVKRLQESLDEFGQPETIAIGPENELYNGHQRLKSWADKFGDIDVDVRVSNRSLTEKEREKLTVFLHKGAAGEWDFDILANEFELDDLLDWGFKEYEIGLREKVIIDYDAMWQGMPEFEQEEAGAFKSIRLHFQNQNDIDDFAELIDQPITEKTKYVWYPKKERMNLKALVAHDES